MEHIKIKKEDYLAILQKMQEMPIGKAFEIYRFLVDTYNQQLEEEKIKQNEIVQEPKQQG